MDGSESTSNKLCLAMAESRQEAATPCTIFSHLFSGLFIKPTPIRTSDEYGGGAPSGGDNGQEISCHIHNPSVPATHDPNACRTPKRQRQSFEEGATPHSEQTDCSQHSQETSADDTVRHPRPTYPDNFKSSRSRSFSDMSTASHYLLPVEGAPSLPCSPRGSINTTTTTSSATTETASPWVCTPSATRERSVTAGSETQRFVSIATPSPAGTPRASSRSCSRNSGAVGGSGSARQVGRKHLPALPHNHSWSIGLSAAAGMVGCAEENANNAAPALREEDETEAEGEGDDGKGSISQQQVLCADMDLSPDAHQEHGAEAGTGAAAEEAELAAVFADAEALLAVDQDQLLPPLLGTCWGPGAEPLQQHQQQHYFAEEVVSEEEMLFPLEM